jgi:Na+-transporting NADH:ubiquinone oxidoreductase subunit C
MQHSNMYIIGFAGAVCIVCSIFVAGSAVGLKDRQEVNKALDRQKKVLSVAGLLKADESLTADEVQKRYNDNIKPKVVNLETGEYDDSVDPAGYDQKKASKDPATRKKAPANKAKVTYLPTHALVYLQMDGEQVKKVILPVEGKGLWSTLYGFMAIENDGNTVAGLTFYEHGETPGLGGEVDNPSWKALWPGRKVYGPDGKPLLAVIKGSAGTPEAAPYKVDGLSGATLTCNGVTALVQFWLGENGFGPYLAKFRAEGR